MKYIKKEGEIMPPFYYGLAYTNWMNYERTYYWMPICYFVQAYRWLRNKWYIVQNIETPLIRDIRRDAIEEGNKLYLKQCEETERYRSAYMACLSAMIDSNVPKHIIDRLHKF